MKDRGRGAITYYRCQGSKHFLETVKMLTPDLGSRVGESARGGACGVGASSTGVMVTVLGQAWGQGE